VKRVAPALLVLAASFTSLVARADPTAAACVEANEHAIQERKKLSLRDAQRDFATCAQASCPADIATECGRQLHDVAVAIPSVVFAAKSDKGDDLTDVRVEMDGMLLAEHLGASAIVVDPGEHTFVLTAKGRGSVTRKLLLREGEKERAETFTFSNVAVVPVVAPPLSQPATKHDATWRVTGAALAGAGLLGVVLGSIFGGIALAASNDQKSLCPKDGCEPGKHDLADAAHDRAVWSSTASTVAFVAGGVLLVTGGVVFFAAPVVRSDRVALSIGGTF